MRPTKPTAIKVVGGTLRKDRVKNEPRPTELSELPLAPDYLDQYASEEWNRIGPELIALGLLTTADLCLFAAYCMTYSRLIKATVSLDEAGEMFHDYTNKVGATNFVARPEIAVIQRETMILKSICSEFGLSPSARGGMDINKIKL